MDSKEWSSPVPGTVTPGRPIFGIVFRLVWFQWTFVACGDRKGNWGRPFWAKPVLRKFSGPRIGSVGASCFVDDFVSCWGKGGCISVADWTQLKLGSYNLVFVWRLNCLLRKEGPSAFCSLRWLLEVFLAIAEFVGFRAGGRLPFEWLYWILYSPLLAPLAPLDSYRSFSAQKETWIIDFFQSIPLLINSINLKRDGVRICLGKDVGRWSIEGFLTPPSFRYRVNSIG